MADIIGVAASAAGGGLFGLVGTTFGRIVTYFERRQTIAHEERRWAHETDLLKLQQTAAAQETEAELAITQAEGSWAGLEASLAAAAAIAPSFKWVNAVRAMTSGGQVVVKLDPMRTAALVDAGVGTHYKGQKNAWLQLPAD
ncbi:MAG: hypothetical protein VXW22_13640, partial [Pseudomonadota bacterium]|nr:hypothetical protein [Pseudomonadota bacterium]